MKVTNLNCLSKLIAKNTTVYVLGEHRTVGVDVGGSLGKVPCSEDLARQIHVLGVSTIKLQTCAGKERYCRFFVSFLFQDIVFFRLAAALSESALYGHSCSCATRRCGCLACGRGCTAVGATYGTV